MTEIALIYVPFGSSEQARKAAHSVVSQRLAACANILATGESIYPWEGAIETAEETVVLFKTAPDRLDALMEALEAAHGYDLPAILSWPARTTQAYADWVIRETRP